MRGDDQAVDPEPGAQLRALTGWPGEPSSTVPAGLIDRMDALAAEVGLATGEKVAWEPLLVDRARRRGFSARGRTSANGSCHLVRAADGWFALSVARPEDRDALGALVGASGAGWAELEEAAGQARGAEVVERARLLGMPAAGLATPSVGGAVASDITRCWEEHRWWPPTRRREAAGMRVVDLSSLWAGPLACSFLRRAGASVLKVQSASRPDPARTTPGFYRSLHPEEQRCETVDFASAPGRLRLRQLVESADVVVEASRPRALEQLGCSPESLAPRPGRVWLSITGYGRSLPNGNWVAFGDDAAVAGGLVGRDAAGEPVFCGDAVADPVTGLVGALAVLRAVLRGGGVLLDVAMARCAAAAAGGGRGATG